MEKCKNSTGENRGNGDEKQAAETRKFLQKGTKVTKEWISNQTAPG
jgi:hypothetical protein